MRRRRPTALAIPAVLIAILAGTLIVVSVWPQGSSPLTVDELSTYEAAITAPLKDGGAIVQEGMKAALYDLLQQHVVPPRMMVGESDAWVVALRNDRAKVAAVPVPSQLKRSRQLFLIALDRYIEAAQDFGKAVANSNTRQQWLDKLDRAGNSADKTYDEASRIIQGWRKKLGLPVSADFPGGG